MIHINQAFDIMRNLAQETEIEVENKRFHVQFNLEPTEITLTRDEWNGQPYTIEVKEEIDMPTELCIFQDSMDNTDSFFPSVDWKGAKSIIKMMEI